MINPLIGFLFYFLIIGGLGAFIINLIVYIVRGNYGKNKLYYKLKSENNEIDENKETIK